MQHVFRSAPLARLAPQRFCGRSSADFTHVLMRLALWPCLLAIFLILQSASLMAQAPTASITGSVADSQGLGVPSATVEATQTATGLTFKGVTSNDGQYSIPSLPIGDYSVTVQVNGFKTFHRTGITLEVAQRLRLDIPLELGSTTDTVTVTAEIPRVQTDDSSLGSIVEQQRITDLPLNGRQPFSLVNIVAGVQTTCLSCNGFADSSNQGFSRIRFNGGPTLGNQFFLDGTADTIPAITEISVVPMADAVQEFRVETNGLKAEFGQTSGGVVNLATKSGTNELHGSLYEFLRNDDLDARNAFATQRDKITGRIKPVLRYNQFGGTMGGPVRIPKLYDGRNRTFFFMGYEQWHYRSSSVTRGTVATPLERTGDFSQTRDSTGHMIPIYDPATTKANPAGNGYVRGLFAGNVVPATRIDSLSANVLKYMPLPNATPDNLFTNVNNYLSLPSSPIDQDVIDTRMDHRISDSDSAFFRYTGTLNVTKANGYGLGVSDPSARYDDRNNFNAAVGETHIFSPALLNEFRVGVTRQDLIFKSLGLNGNWPQKLGYSSILPQDVFPAVAIAGKIGIGYQSTYSEGYRAQHLVEFADSMTWIHSAHQVKFGLDHRFTRLNWFAQTYPSGYFSFDGGLTNNPQVPAGSGIGMATFLLGQVSSGQQTVTPAFALGSWSEGWFIQDDYKVNRRLTVNLGLRYDMSAPPVERYNRYSDFDPGLKNTSTGLLGGLTYAGATRPSSFVNWDHNNFGPHAGFAYLLTSDARTVVRGGYSLIYAPVESADMHGNAPNSLGFSTSTPFSTSGPYAAFQFSAGPTVLLQPLGANGGPNAFRGQSVNFQDPVAPAPYVQQWNLTIQRELIKDWTIGASYVGNHGVKLIGGNYSMNQYDPKYYAEYGLALQNQVANPFYGQIATGALSGKTVALSQTLRPYPDYQGITTLAAHNADSIYHSIQLSIEHRFSKGLSMLASFTGGKLIDDSTANDSGESGDGSYRLGAFNRRLDRAVDPSDISRRMTLSGVWELPFAKQSHGLYHALVYGWQTNGILTMQTGTPLSVTGANNFTGLNYPDLIADPTLSNRTVKEWFNVNAFANPANFVVGNAPRTLPSTRGPSFAQLDFSVFRTFSFLERFKLEVRGEAFNLLNHVNLSNPNTGFSPNAQGVNTNSAFGTITSSYAARQMQVGMHMTW